MALDAGGGGAGGSIPGLGIPGLPGSPGGYSGTPLISPSYTPPSNPPPSYNIYAGIQNANNNPIINTPNYAALLDQYMGPYRSAAQQQMDILNRQMSLAEQGAGRMRGFAQDEYGTNLASAKEAHSHTLANILNNLIARGILRSGAKKVRTGVENRRFGRETSLMSTDLERYLFGLQQSLAQQRLSNEGQMASINAGLAQQSMSLAPWLAQMYPATSSPAPGSMVLY